MPGIVPTAVAAIMAVLSGCEPPRNHPGHEHHPSRVEVESLMAEAVEWAPKASGWAGYELGAEMACVTGIAESNWHNMARHCAGAPSDRSSGYFGITAPAWGRFAPRVGVYAPPRQLFDDRDTWTRRTCEYVFRNPREQVRVLYALLAYYVRQERGNLNRVLAIYAEGQPYACEYTWQVHDLYRRIGFKWPRDGQLTRIGPETAAIHGRAGWELAERTFLAGIATENERRAAETVKAQKTQAAPRR